MLVGKLNRYKTLSGSGGDIPSSTDTELSPAKKEPGFFRNAWNMISTMFLSVASVGGILSVGGDARENARLRN